MITSKWRLNHLNNMPTVKRAWCNHYVKMYSPQTFVGTAPLFGAVGHPARFLWGTLCPLLGIGVGRGSTKDLAHVPFKKLWPSHRPDVQDSSLSGQGRELSTRTGDDDGNAGKTIKLVVTEDKSSKWIRKIDMTSGSSWLSCATSEMRHFWLLSGFWHHFEKLQQSLFYIKKREGRTSKKTEEIWARGEVPNN